MGLGKLNAYYEVVALSLLLTTSAQTTLFFGHNYFFRKRSNVTLSAFIASILGLWYSLYKLGYWYFGLGGLYTCYNMWLITAIQGSCNAVAHFYLFLRANAVNRLNPRWRYIRFFAISIIIATCFTLFWAVVNRTSKIVMGSDGLRCMFVTESLALTMKFSFQLINQVMQSGLFVWPLVKHLQYMKRSENSGLHSVNSMKLCRHVAERTIAAMVVSAVVTGFVTILALFWNKWGISTACLGIFETAVTLGSIYFARNCDRDELISSRTNDSGRTFRPSQNEGSANSPV